MSVAIELTIYEFFEDKPPEHFGYMPFPAGKFPEPGEVIMLKWLDGSEAYRVEVTNVRGIRLDVMRVE